MKEYVVGIDVGGTRIQVGLFKGSEIIAEKHFLTDKEIGATEMMDLLANQVRKLAAASGLTLEDIRGVGASFPSYIDYEKGMCVETSNIMSLNDQPVRDMLRERLGVPVYVDNDGNLAALAEHELGAGRGYDNLIYAELSTGIGGGLILNGKLYRGMHGTYPPGSTWPATPWTASRRARRAAYWTTPAPSPTSTRWPWAGR